jgi:multiple sugar transport system substrate-binding protein
MQPLGNTNRPGVEGIMIHSQLSRRRLLAGLGGLGAATVLGGCATGSSDSGTGTSSTLIL